MSQHAKALVASLVAVAYAGLAAWQAASGNGFQWPDLFPVTAAVGGAVLTYAIPNLPEFPHAKAVVTGALQAVAAVSVLYQNGGVAPNLVAILLAVAGTFAVHRVPNTVPAAAHAEHQA